MTAFGILWFLISQTFWMICACQWDFLMCSWNCFQLKTGTDNLCSLMSINNQRVYSAAGSGDAAAHIIWASIEFWPFLSTNYKFKSLMYYKIVHFVINNQFIFPLIFSIRGKKTAFFNIILSKELDLTVHLMAVFRDVTVSLGIHLQIEFFYIFGVL